MHHYNYQFDFEGDLIIYQDGQILLATAQLKSFRLKPPIASNITICPDYCERFSIHDLMIWSGLHQYTPTLLKYSNRTLGLNSKLLSYFSFDENSGSVLREKAFQYQVNLQRYNHTKYYKIVRWEDTDFFFSNPVPTSLCQFNQIYDDDTEECELMNDAWETIEFQVTKNALELDLETDREFSPEWTMEFFFKFTVYQDMTSFPQFPIITADTSCDSNGTTISVTLQDTSDRYLQTIIKQTVGEKQIFYTQKALTEVQWYYFILRNQIIPSPKLYHQLDFNADYDLFGKAVQMLAPCKYKIAYASDATTDHLKLRLRMKEFRIWNKAMSIVELQEYERTTLPLRFPSLAVLIKMNNFDFIDEITGRSNFKADFKDFKIKYDNQTRNNCPLGMRQTRGNCDYNRGKTIDFGGQNKLTINFESTIEKFQQDQELDFTLVFILRSYFNKDINAEFQLQSDNIHILNNKEDSDCNYPFKYSHQEIINTQFFASNFMDGLYVFDYTNGQISYPSVYPSQLIQWASGCIGGMNNEASFMQGCLPKAELYFHNASLSYSFVNSIDFKWQFSTGLWYKPIKLSQISNFYSYFYLLPGIIGFGAFDQDHSKNFNFCVITVKESTKVKKCFDNVIFQEDQWYGITTVKTNQGYWLFYLKNMIIGQVENFTEPFSGQLKSISIGDYSLADAKMKIKNVFGIAKELYSLLFYYKLDEDVGSTFYDSSLYGNNINSLSIKQGNNGKILWDPQWERVLMNEETWTNDFINYQYMDRGILFQKGKTQKLVLQNIQDMSQEYTIQLCLYLTDLSAIETEVLGLTQLTKLNVAKPNKIIHQPNLNSRLEYDSDIIIYKSWLYIALGNSFINNELYLVLDNVTQSTINIKNESYKSEISGLVSFYIGSDDAAYTFSGYLRHIKIFRKFLSVGQAFQILHHKTGIINSMNNINLASLYPLTEPMGNLIREQVSGVFTINDSYQYEYISYPSLPIMCDGDTQYSNRGYCQPSKKILQLIDEISIIIDAKYTKCFSVSFWVYFQSIQQFQMQIQNRVYLDVDLARDSVLLQQSLNDAPFMKIAGGIGDKYLNNWMQITFKLCDQIKQAYLPKNKDLSILIGYFKLDESGGSYLYNTATHAKISRVLQLVDGRIKWAYETVISDQNQTHLDIKCNEPSIFFKKSNNDDYYLDCYQDCSKCNEPWINNCDRCLNSLYEKTCIFICPKYTIDVYDSDLDQNVCKPYVLKNRMHSIQSYLNQTALTHAKKEHIMIKYIQPAFLALINAKLALDQIMGPGSDKCVKCASDYAIYLAKCTLCDLIPGFKLPMIERKCTEICGDGKRLGQNECDDGNLNNGDGCDENCIIEPGFSCENSMCQKQEPPKLIIQSFSSTQIAFSFNQPMKTQEGSLTNDDLELSIKLPDNTEKNLTWTGEIDQESIRKNKYNLQIKIQFSLKGDEVLVIKLLSNRFKPQKQGIPNSISQQSAIKLLPYEYKNKERSDLMMAIIGQAQTVIISVVSSNMVAQILMQGIMSQMFEMINTLQILYYMPLIQVYYPQDLRDFLDFLSTSKFNIPVPGISDPESFINNLIDEKDYKEKIFNQAFFDFGIQVLNG
ncbi:UNKNOWN [Stylonychia lemnae]|uniref:Cadg multi-domain protein n=1 Tax=Stylonychia lemnae TaxID=5949 RepID=A0A078APX1_STYLE|nr:UNKNOWN [Stylonychia lemnae]|eukprot:CDW83342.1 UNKNOWN [Stylonychia lemnae]